MEPTVAGSSAVLRVTCAPTACVLLSFIGIAIITLALAGICIMAVVRMEEYMDEKRKNEEGL